MSNLKKDIVTDLREKFEVDEYFYPKISMDIDMSMGLKGEVDDITKTLEENGFESNSENAFRIMELKKELLIKYNETEDGKAIIAEYSRILLEEIKPVGIAIPIELVLVNGLIALMLYGLGRFVGSFADESGKILARKLLEKDKEHSKELNIDLREYRFLKTEAGILIQDGKTLVNLKHKLTKKRDNHK